ncbi:pentapeptide repeat-containing protein [Ruegeria sp. 2205SS24-7]|uniref:pentapeptide repeat-containing protein n=1 Tax=Ruegeria discodermiae TaxID=3064389 RepID=UPI0027412BAD|nr:pentapeptide repeat-containing protein [Ruegeria sp. 2205SS24-7]MDP5216594.1 pentapeptide repeat-containing protein [Ruegeria sp. 2205SS24-7]
MPRKVYISKRKPPDTSAVDRINELSKIARTSWFGLLAYLAFAGVTLLGVQDADFFIDSRQTALPLIGVEIPTRDFFVFGPILGTALVVYLHLYLLKLWEALATAPPRPKGEALSLQVTPWLINDLGLALRRDGAFHRRPMDWLSHLVTFLLVFAIGPIVTGYFWVRYWPAHELGYSILNALLFTLTTMTMLSSLFTAVTRLRYGMTYRGGWWHLLALVPTLAIAVPTIALTIAKTDGPESLGPFRGVTEWAYDRTNKALVAISPLHRPHPAGYPLRIARADLREVVFTPLPDDWLAHEVHRRQFRVDWCARQGLDPETCGRASEDGGLDRHNETARAKWCEENRYDPGFQCDDHFSRLEARFAEAWKTERRAALSALASWSPRNKDLRHADLARTVILAADLRVAQMQGAVLREAEIQGADLRAAEMQGADLSEAEILGADLSFADMRGADWAGGTSAALAQSADIRGSDSLTQVRLSSLIGDARTLLPDTPDPGTGQPLFIPSCWVSEPEGWSVLVENLSPSGFSEDDMRADFLCKPGTRPQKTGTPWPVDQPPPWESDPNWQPEDRGPVAQDAPDAD